MKCRNINLIAACACLVCGIFFTVTGRPTTTVTQLVVIGLANLGFVLAR
jgi:hypothetical protein